MIKKILFKIFKKELCDPKFIVEAIFENGLNWYDYEKLDKLEQLNYYQDIQKILINKSFQNEIQHFMADLVQEIAMSEADHNRDKMLRYSLNGVKTLMERLESIQDPREKEKSKEDIFNPI
jgi:poly-D-alanine transfer protein DltD